MFNLSDFSNLIQVSHTKTKKIKRLKEEERWKHIGKIIEDVQKLHHRHHTFLERLEDLSIKPATGTPIAVLVVLCAFWVIRFVAENLITYLADPFFEKVWMPLIMKISAFLGGGGFLHDIIIGKFIEGELDVSIEKSDPIAHATFLPEGSWLEVGRIPIDDYKKYALTFTVFD